MATTFADLVAKVDILEGVINDEQLQIASTINGLKATIADLQAIIDSGSVITSDQLDAVIAKIDSEITDLQSTIPDSPQNP